jgi:hypothetical protein
MQIPRPTVVFYPATARARVKPRRWITRVACPSPLPCPKLNPDECYAKPRLCRIVGRSNYPSWRDEGD